MNPSRVPPQAMGVSEVMGIHVLNDARGYPQDDSVFSPSAVSEQSNKYLSADQRYDSKRELPWPWVMKFTSRSSSFNSKICYALVMSVTLLSNMAHS